MKGREWMAQWLDIRILPEFYYSIVFLGIWVILILTTPNLFKALRNNWSGYNNPIHSFLYKNKWSVAKNKTNMIKENITVYRYKFIWVCLMAVAIITLTYIMVLIISNIESSKTTNIYKMLPFFSFFFLFPVGSFVYLIYMLLYSVRVDRIGITIAVEGFYINKFALNEISIIRYGGGKGPVTATVKLFNGKSYSFVSWLKNSWRLFYTLSEHCNPAGRPVDNPFASLSSSNRPYPE